MTADQRQAGWLKALIEEAALAIGPIARLLVDRLAADAASFDDIRWRVAERMDDDTRTRFLQATKALADQARPDFAPPPDTPRPGPAVTAETLDQSDPAFVRALVSKLVDRLGPDAEATVLEAARRCRTKMQLCLRLASTVADPELKADLSERALDDFRLRQSRGR